MDQYSQGIFGMQESSHPRFSFGHPKTPETFERRYSDHFDGYSHCQKAMTPYVVQTPPGLVRYSLPSLPETPSPTYSSPTPPHWVGPTPVCCLPHPPVTSGALPTPPSSPVIYSGLDFWTSFSSCTGSREAQIVGMAQTSQLEFEYEEYSDESLGTPEIQTSYFSEDDGYYASGEDSSCIEDYMDESSESETREANAGYFSEEDDGYHASGEDSSSVGDSDEIHTSTESHGSSATLTTSGSSSLLNLPHLGFIRKPLTSQGREYEEWLESQDEPSGRSDSPEIHSPIPRHLVQWRNFPL